MPISTDPQDTRERILDATERLFAEKGQARTSLRQITAAAEVNLAAVHYHFGSKQGLVEAVYDRHLGPMNRDRLRLLDLWEQSHPDGDGALEQLVEAFVGPILRLKQEDPVAARSVRCLIGRIYSQGGEEMLPVLRHFDEVRERFPAALKRSLPHLDEVEVMWRIHFLLGAMFHTAGTGHLLSQLTGGLCDPADSETALRHLVDFTCAGLRAAPSRKE
ncbi:MAG: TetR/AcrR family transcriptional regulator [Gemmatimonadetes bacterium]|jgi:AcrR family transcriptional regulator|nr:TetR/AcrR family transcriptional regulator [Gemmatimonadota bacterium]MBT6144430.1 TetR/AcrR family transcriptional regulator [Gemmatimonadota bacterium]MBT7864496.1 TetR/AcrR family transcriptional regulator [Gemmatimonadota bacterium]